MIQVEPDQAKLRKALARDCILLHEWVNQPDVRASALRDGGPIPLCRHEQWFAEKLNDPTCWIWIIEISARPVGQVRLDRTERGFEVDIFVEPEARKGGVAGHAITSALQNISEQMKSCPAIAFVRTENKASRALFESLGFTIAEIFTDHVIYRLDRP